MKSKATIALGSNLGEKERNLFSAIEAIKEFPKSSFLGVSDFHETIALTEFGEDKTKPSYLNAICQIETELSPFELLQYCAEIESNMGRVRTGRWQDRNIDVDIIAFGNQVVDTDSLSIPHPRAHERLFVLLPWQEVEPDAEIVGKGKIKDLIARLR